jgi:hypothetical protein
MKQYKGDYHLLVKYDQCITEYPNVLFNPPDGNKVLPRHHGEDRLYLYDLSLHTFITYVLSYTIPIVPHLTMSWSSSLNGDRNRRSNLEFHIWWAVFSEAHDCW